MERMASNTICQVAVVVRDIEAARANYAKVFGKTASPVMETDGWEKSRAEYRGEKTGARAKLAFVEIGPGVMLEFIEPVGGPSTWKEFLDRHGPGIHHVALTVKGMKEHTEFLGTRGIPLVQKGEYGGGRYAYCDATGLFGMILELLENDGKS